MEFSLAQAGISSCSFVPYLFQFILLGFSSATGVWCFSFPFCYGSSAGSFPPSTTTRKPALSFPSPNRPVQRISRLRARRPIADSSHQRARKMLLGSRKSSENDSSSWSPLYPVGAGGPCRSSRKTT